MARAIPVRTAAPSENPLLSAHFCLPYIPPEPAKCLLGKLDPLIKLFVRNEKFLRAICFLFSLLRRRKHGEAEQKEDKQKSKFKITNRTSTNSIPSRTQSNGEIAKSSMFASNIYISKYNLVFAPQSRYPESFTVASLHNFCLLMETCMNYYSADKTFLFVWFTSSRPAGTPTQLLTRSLAWLRMNLEWISIIMRWGNELWNIWGLRSF